MQFRRHPLRRRQNAQRVFGIVMALVLIIGLITILAIMMPSGDQNKNTRGNIETVPTATVGGLSPTNMTPLAPDNDQSGLTSRPKKPKRPKRPKYPVEKEKPAGQEEPANPTKTENAQNLAGSPEEPEMSGELGVSEGVGESESPVGALPMTGINTFDLHVKAVRNRFYKLYGGKEIATAMYKKAILGFPGGELHTAARLLRSRIERRSFVMAFGGYSVTTGRGNRFEQSFPFVLRDVLDGPLKSLGVDLEVRNAGQGGISSLPFGWCLPNFLGSDADVVSWDFRFNEGTDSASFEAYLRQTLQFQRGAPKFILLAKKSPTRKGVLRKYVKDNVLADPIVLDASYPPDSHFLALEEDQRPEGFQDFETYGAPEGSPGQGAWIPTYKWHQMMGWILAMHMLDAAETASKIIQRGEDEILAGEVVSMRSMPAPVNEPDNLLVERETNLLFGDTSSRGQWYMPKTTCASTFSPIYDGPAMTDLVVSGVQQGAVVESENTDFGKGWIMGFGSDASEQEYQAYRALGFQDKKVVYRGLHTSGALKLWMPWGGHLPQYINTRSNSPERALQGHSVLEDGPQSRASRWFKSLVVCQYFETSDKSNCNVDTDMKFVVGGVAAKHVQIMQAIGTRWLRKPLCAHIDIPPEAVVTSHRQSGIVHHDLKPADLGLTLEISVTNEDLAAIPAPCSISHIVWQDAAQVQNPALD